MQTALTNSLYGHCPTCGLGVGHVHVIDRDCDRKFDRSHGNGCAIPALLNVQTRQNQTLRRRGIFLVFKKGFPSQAIFQK